MEKEYKAYLYVRKLETGEEVDKIGLTNTNHRHVEKVMSGMLRNMSDEYFIDDSECDDVPVED
jgi:hypothetical protein